MQKPLFDIDISNESEFCLESQQLLAMLDENSIFHIANGFRHPLGIYNVSVSRVCNKIIRLCGYLEEYFRFGKTLDSLNSYGDEMQKIIDYVELALYASAEHVDDVYSIATWCFQDKTIAKKNSGYKKLDKLIKEHKKFIATTANHIKHQQSRIRMFSMEFCQGNEAECLHGYFFEGVDNGVVCPHLRIHKEQDVFSLTTFIWESIYLLLNLSQDLSLFLKSSATLLPATPKTQSCSVPKAVVAAARLPIYTFGEEHPFSRATLKIKSDENNFDMLDSKLYGSIESPWSRSLGASFGKAISRFEGDGTTKSFRFAHPKKVAIQHWD